MTGEWRGLHVGDVYHIACFPDHPKTIDRIDAYPGGGEWRGVTGIEWATVWGVHPDRYRTRSEMKIHVDATGRPVWRRYEDRPRVKGGVFTWWYEEIPIVIVQRASTTMVQLDLFGGQP